MKKLTLVLLLISHFIFAQSTEGYWDNIRTTNQTITLTAGEKKIIKTADFPTGTTEVVYRITILDENQKMASSLVSVLKAVPDPSGISQGSAGAIFLLSTISGDDKCKYAVFANNADADNFIKSKKNTNACIIQSEPINKEAKLLSEKANCFNENTTNLYFVFESNNWVMNEKIVLEVVPWINKKASRGWNNQTKQEILDLSNSLTIVSSLTKKDQFKSAFLDAIQQKYTYSDFNKLLPIEKAKEIDAITEQSLLKTGEINKLYESYRQQANQLALDGKTNQAIATLQTEIFNKNRATAIDYCFLGKYYLLTKQFDKAEKTINEGITLDASEINLQLQLAHLYMFTDRVSEAKDIHKKYRNQNVAANTSWINQTKTDFLLFQKTGLPTDDFKKINRILD